MGEAPEARQKPAHFTGAVMLNLPPVEAPFYRIATEHTAHHHHLEGIRTHRLFVVVTVCLSPIRRSLSHLGPSQIFAL